MHELVKMGDKILSEFQIYCPLCKDYFKGSDYLATVFSSSTKQLWLANTVMHYRHNHISYYNRWVHYHSRFRGDYDDFKGKVNNRAKRQLIRKCKKFLQENNITVEDFGALQGTDKATIKLAMKHLPVTSRQRSIYFDFGGSQ